MASSSKSRVSSEGDDDHILIPPKPKFHLEDGGANDAGDSQFRGSHSRTTSNTQDSPPVTPQSATTFMPTDNRQSNPFTPPASVLNFSVPNSPMPQMAHARLPSFDNHAMASGSRATSYTDLQPSWYGAPTTLDSRPGTPRRDSFQTASARPGSSRFREAFRAPPTRDVTMYSTVNLSKVARNRQKSTLLSATAPDGVDKPWLATRDPYTRISYFVTVATICVGLIGGFIRCYTGWYDVPVMTGKLCSVVDEDFSRGEEGIFGENGLFFREVDMSGFGNGEFEMTVDSSTNSFVRDGKLYIVPTLTADAIGEAAITDGYVYNATGCTYNITHGATYTQESKNAPANVTWVSKENEFDAGQYQRACSASSNHTIAQVINPVQSARLNTRRTASIKFGRVEVVAKLPTGDWLWPAIWMLPVENTYGAWPLSGEIDIMESRGNGPRYKYQGVNVVRGSLNWGPMLWLNAVSKTFGFRGERRQRFDRAFHTYAIEWDEEFIRIYVDNRLHYMLEQKIKKSFWDLGEFPGVVMNGSQAIILDNPWKNGTKAAPFDQSFYLIISLGVGGTNGWFPDSDDKPWLNSAPNAMAEFWRRREEWLPSWGQSTDERAFIIDSVKMWQKC